jgi:hypothetical protein
LLPLIEIKPYVFTEGQLIYTHFYSIILHI